MKAAERRQEILRMATSNGLASVDELSAQFGVTGSTIRRDLAALAKSGGLARTYGGAMAVPVHREPTVTERRSESHEAKRAIGIWAAGQVTPGETVLLDAGTTTAAVAHALRAVVPLTVVTTGLTPLSALIGAEGIEVICLGGTFRDVSQSFIGPLAERALESFTFDHVFLGADAVTAEHGICEATQGQLRIKELMTRRGRATYVLAHAAKLGAMPFHAWLRGAWTVVTDESAAPEQIAPFTAAGIPIVVAPSGRLRADTRA
ncbi:MAG: DeoR/GlpR family DNA-binding transcription regulator [Propioniciclava sp.]